MKETKYQELKKEIAELKENYFKLLEHHVSECHGEPWSELEEHVMKCESRLDVWDRRLAKWAKKMELE